MVLPYLCILYANVLSMLPSEMGEHLEKKIVVAH